VDIDSDESRSAVALASESPHPLVRIEALGHLEGVSGIRLRTELRKLLADDQLEVRLAALKAMQDNGIAAAGPFLVLRIQDAAFIKQSYEERQQSIQTLASLRPRRAEEVCIKLLGESKLFRSEAFEDTRELAVKCLAEVATTRPAFFLLDEISRSNRLRASKGVREAAAAALDRIAQRAQQAEDDDEEGDEEEEAVEPTAEARAQPTRKMAAKPQGSQGEASPGGKKRTRKVKRRVKKGTRRAKPKQSPDSETEPRGAAAGGES